MWRDFEKETVDAMRPHRDRIHLMTQAGLHTAIECGYPHDIVVLSLAAIALKVIDDAVAIRDVTNER